MNEEFQNRGKSSLELVESEVKKRMGYFPDLGYKIGFYVYTPWSEVMPVQSFDREKIVAALDGFRRRGPGRPDCGGGSRSSSPW